MFSYSDYSKPENGTAVKDNSIPSVCCLGDIAWVYAGRQGDPKERVNGVKGG